MSSEFRFLLSNRCLTEKVYGITVRRTRQALTDLGVEASIFTPNSAARKFDDFGNHFTNGLGNKSHLSYM